MSKAPQQRIDIVNLITNFSGRDNNIVIPRPFLKWCGGDLGIALFLSECLYWSDKTKDPDGWFARTAEEWEQATTLSRDSIDRAYVTLVSIGLQREVRRSEWHHFVPVLHYRFNQSLLRDAATKFFTSDVPLSLPNFKETREVLKREGEERRQKKLEKGLRSEHKSECVSDTNTESCVEHESYTENNREEEENKKEIAADAAHASDIPPQVSDKWTIAQEADEMTALPVGKQAQAQRTKRAEKKLQRATTPPPPNGAAAPSPKRKQSALQAENAANAEALGKAWGVPPAPSDYGLYILRVKKLAESGITQDRYQRFCDWVKSDAGDFASKLTVAHITEGGRISKFLQWDKENAGKETANEFMERMRREHPERFQERDMSAPRASADAIARIQAKRLELAKGFKS